MNFTLHVPIHTKSPNVAENGWARSSRRKIERRATWLAWLEHRPVLGEGERATVTLTRVGARDLDPDNLAGACKSLRDTISALLILGEMPGKGRMGHYDSDPRLTWRYGQERGGKYAVRIDIETEATR